MGSMSLTHWLIFGVIVLLLFGGGGKISSIMGDVAKGIKSFKKGMQEDEVTAQTPPQTPPAAIDAQKAQSAQAMAPQAMASQAAAPAAAPAAQPKA
jgi:sec-independent protein translocase protein TatA